MWVKGRRDELQHTWYIWRRACGSAGLDLTPIKVTSLCHQLPPDITLAPDLLQSILSTFIPLPPPLSPSLSPRHSLRIAEHCFIIFASYIQPSGTHMTVWIGSISIVSYRLLYRSSFKKKDRKLQDERMNIFWTFYSNFPSTSSINMKHKRSKHQSLKVHVTSTQQGCTCVNQDQNCAVLIILSIKGLYL